MYATSTTTTTTNELSSNDRLIIGIGAAALIINAAAALAIAGDLTLLYLVVGLMTAGVLAAGANLICVIGGTSLAEVTRHFGGEVKAEFVRQWNQAIGDRLATKIPCVMAACGFKVSRPPVPFATFPVATFAPVAAPVTYPVALPVGRFPLPMADMAAVEMTRQGETIRATLALEMARAMASVPTAAEGKAPTVTESLTHTPIVIIHPVKGGWQLTHGDHTERHALKANAMHLIKTWALQFDAEIVGGM